MNLQCYSNFTTFNSYITLLLPGKTYSTNIEEARRQMAWQDNLMYVTKHNMEAAQGKHTYTVDMNQFADLVG